MFRFQHPEYFLLTIPLLIVLIIFYVGRRLYRKKMGQIGEARLLSPLMPNVSNVRPYLKFYILFVALSLLLLVLAQPQFGISSEEVKREGIEVVIALDVSNSMMAQDVQPTRLDKAKHILSKLIDKMEDDKVGLIVFAGDAYVQVPMTADYVSAKMFLSSLSTDLIPRQGTAIGSALDLSIKAFGSNSKAGKAIILLTDGENHEDDALAAAKLASEKGIRVDVVGMGRPEGAPIPINGSMSFKKNRNGEVIVSKLNENMCNEIAKVGNGIYVRADNSTLALRTIAKDLDTIAKSEITEKVYAKYNEQFQSFAFIALFLLLLDTFIFGRKNKWLSRINIFEVKK